MSCEGVCFNGEGLQKDFEIGLRHRDAQKCRAKHCANMRLGKESHESLTCERSYQRGVSCKDMMIVVSAQHSESSMVSEFISHC